MSQLQDAAANGRYRNRISQLIDSTSMGVTVTEHCSTWIQPLMDDTGTEYYSTLTPRKRRWA